MPRQARKKSESKIYHAILRGINQQRILESTEDSDKFLELLQEGKDQGSFRLLGYCLMGNHVHLLLQEAEEDLEHIFKRIGSKYVYWYNVKYQRVGHLFQDRFKSEPVDDDRYLLTVIRYIHQNPLKAGVCEKLEAYPYSSFTEYISGGDLVDTELILGMLPKEEFKAFHQETSNDVCMDIDTTSKKRLTDEQARTVLKKLVKVENISEIQQLDPAKQIKVLVRLHKDGASIRQLSRLTGIPKGIIERRLKSK